MVGSKIVVVAFFLVALLVASSAVSAAADASFFPDCYNRCANGNVGDVGWSNMCAKACIVPTKTPDGIDLASLISGGQ